MNGRKKCQFSVIKTLLELRGGLNSVNFDCFVSNKYKCFDCNAKRKPIKVSMNWYNIRKYELTKTSIGFEGFS